MKNSFATNISILLIALLVSVNGYSQVKTGKPDPWTKFAFLYGSAPSLSAKISFMYRKFTDAKWITVASERMRGSDTTFVAKVQGLAPDTRYVFKAISANESGAEVEFTTDKATQMPNMGFDDWVMNKRAWFPGADMDANYWWDSGNRGANALGQRNPTSPEESFVIKGKAAKMETVSVVGVMAGGNVFSGQFTETLLFPRPGAKVDFGRPFTSRPTKLHGYYCYEPKPINKVKDPYKKLEGRPDRCHIFVMMFDTDTPYKVNTAEKRYLPSYDDPCVVGYADYVDSIGTGGKYREFNLDIIYKDHRKPKYCAVVAVASYYADFFTGGIGTLMYADEFSFIYDADVKWQEKAWLKASR